MLLVYVAFVLISLGIFMRYRVKARGLEEVYRKGNKGILFLPNHPALIDPLIMSRLLFKRFHPRALVDEKQIRQTALKYIQKSARLIALPDMGITGKAGAELTMKQMDICVDSLKQGDNLLMYPAGHIYHSCKENLGGSTGLAYILSKYPDVRIVLVRTRGLWGSSFSRSCGYQQPFMTICKAHLKHLLGNFLFFGPRRPVEIEFVEMPTDFPKTEGKEKINRYLESFYNKDYQGNTYVPYYWWEKGGIRTLAEPDEIKVNEDTSDVPEEIKNAVFAKLREFSPVTDIKESMTLGTDLGLDSLMVAELQMWVQSEFGHQVNNIASLRTVGSLLLASIGQMVSGEPLKPVPKEWYVKEDDRLLEIPEHCPKVTDTFLALAKARPNFVLLADQNTGALTQRKALLAIMVLKKLIETIPGERLGIIMPACLPETLVFMATLFAGKIPVMVNWTVGARNMEYCLKNAGVEHVVTSKLVVESLTGRGTDFSTIQDKMIFLEDLKAGLSLFTKLGCLFNSYFNWSSLRNAKVPDTAVILFTSGSENRPKTVPLSHENIIKDIGAAMSALGLRRDDCVVGMLPPFHSFGVLICNMMPMVANLRVVYHANPMEGDMLARIISAYHPTMIVGTPTFAAGILRNGTQEQLRSIRMMITGAEKCTEATFRLFEEKCPKAYFLEGYGITECAPVVALNRPGVGHCKKGSIGTLISSLEGRVCDENQKVLPPGATGMLYLHGESVFSGYLNYDGPSPFVEMDGKSWYRTGDLVSIDDEGFVFFKGRLKRFVKIGGEMVSLPAIEEILLKLYRTEEEPLPLAVEAVGSDAQPEILLFTKLDLDRTAVNQQIRDAGLSPIHYIRRIVKIAEVPLLGTGKTDYRSLKELA